MIMKIKNKQTGKEHKINTKTKYAHELCSSSRYFDLGQKTDDAKIVGVYVKCYFKTHVFAMCLTCDHASKTNKTFRNNSQIRR